MYYQASKLLFNCFWGSKTWMDKHAFRKFTYIQWLLWKKLFVLGTTKKNTTELNMQEKSFTAHAITIQVWRLWTEKFIFIAILCIVMLYKLKQEKYFRKSQKSHMFIVVKDHMKNVWKLVLDIFIIQIWTWRKKASILFSQKMNATFSLFTQQSALFYSIEFFKFKYLLVPFYSAN